MPKQMQLDLRGDTFLRELELFEMLYGVRCVEGAAWKPSVLDGETCGKLEPTSSTSVRSPIYKPLQGMGFAGVASCHLPQSAFND